MILVDKNIKELSSRHLLIKTGYKESNVSSISYDLTLGNFLDSAEPSREILPGEFLIIKTNEELSIPDNITGRIGEKNSLLRLGLKVEGPQYQPGHITYAFLRIQNLSDKVIVLQKDMPIAQIYFEELKEVPDRTYDKQPGASFHKEKDYRGYGTYENKYKESIKS